MNAVFVKTSKGVDEIESRRGGLTPRIRRVLILIDGKRPVEDIRDMALADDLTHTLGLLEESGYIELLSPVADKARKGQSSITAFRELPAKPDPKEMAMAANFIMNTLKTFCGPATHLSIYEAVTAARNPEELRSQFAPWYSAIVATRDGRRRAEELRSQLLKVI